MSDQRKIVGQIAMGQEPQQWEVYGLIFFLIFAKKRSR